MPYMLARCCLNKTAYLLGMFKEEPKGGGEIVNISNDYTASLLFTIPSTMIKDQQDKVYYKITHISNIIHMHTV